MYIVPRLDLMIAYSCNLSCVGCISLSDLPRSGIAPTNDIFSWIDNWSKIINPKILSVFGGEPCIHPDLIKICKEIQSKWPLSTIRLITNGYLLDNFDVNDWYTINNLEIQVSVHRKDHEKIINQKIKNILACEKKWKVSLHGGKNEHKQIFWTNNKLTIYKSIFKDFVVPYKDNIVPWNSRPEDAHKICGSPSTPILYKGKLYKCPPVANIIDITNKTFCNYNGVEYTDDVNQFINRIGKPEPVCGFCPDHTQAVIIDHSNIKNVKTKQKIFN